MRFLENYKMPIKTACSDANQTSSLNPFPIPNPLPVFPPKMQVREDVDRFKVENPAAWSHLSGLWKHPEQVCPAYLPPGVHIHGNVTSNNVESFNFMALPVRRQANLLASLLHMIHLLTRRHDSSFLDIPSVVASPAMRPPQSPASHPALSLTKATDDAIDVQNQAAKKAKLNEQKVLLINTAIHRPPPCPCTTMSSCTLTDDGLFRTRS